MEKKTSKSDGNCYCLDCLLCFRIENNLKSRKKYVKIKFFTIL